MVRIEAFADPTAPDVSIGQSHCDPGEEIDKLIEQTRHMSERELMDQVHRRLTVHLCMSCYQRWIEDPVGMQ